MKNKHYHALWWASIFVTQAVLNCMGYSPANWQWGALVLSTSVTSVSWRFMYITAQG